MYDNADFEQESRGVVRLASASTASYAVILDNKGDCQFGIGDLKIHDQLTVDKVQKKNCPFSSILTVTDSLFWIRSWDNIDSALAV